MAHVAVAKLQTSEPSRWLDEQILQASPISLSAGSIPTPTGPSGPNRETWGTSAQDQESLAAAEAFAAGFEVT